ncbi:hypothetical protein QYM36_016451 [Artemia franciscana]|uniref:Uncharacterized protein n=1 Tax=Artemia franciscana TaxID=6661 RepID=A0AA88KWF2_ARTSF|nr:hypothetical protein QYM36_016451 [Artemia franciscana]
MSFKIMNFINFYIGVLSVEALICDNRNPTDKICWARGVGTIEVLTVEKRNLVSDWSTGRRNTYKIKAKHVYSESEVLLDDIIVLDCNPDSGIDCSIPDIAVGKTYAVATKLEKNKDNDKSARRILGLCYSWYMDFEELNDKQRKWLQEVDENCKKCNRLPKTNCVPFPKSISTESNMEPEKGSIEAVIIFVIVFGGLFGAALVFGAFICWRRRQNIPPKDII